MVDFLPDYCQYDSAGRLVVDGCPAHELAVEFDTPLYVLLENAVRDRAAEYVSAMQAYPAKTMVAYAGKALLNTAVCRLVRDLGLYLDVVSGGELYTALRAGYPAERVLFHGNNKEPHELELALQAGVGRIVVDNLDELSMLTELAKRRAGGRQVDIMLRVVPGVTANTHHYIETGQLDSKFGLDIGHGHARAAVAQLREGGPLRLVGVHVHIGSQILTIQPYREAVAKALEFLTDMREEFGFIARELDMGGGLGIRYTGDEDPPSVQSYLGTMSDMVVSLCQQLNYPLPALIVEPGRSMVGEAGLTLYTVGTTKDIPGVRRFAAVDGGMADNPRPTLYSATYRAVPVQKHAAGQGNASEPLSIVGRFCESGDVLIPDSGLRNLRRGDLIAVLSTGAYAYSMASNYNRVPRPAMVMVRSGQAAVIVERERYRDIVRNDRVPGWLE